MDLDRVDGGLQVGVGRRGLGEMRDGGKVRAALVGRGGGVVGGGLGELHLQQHVCLLMLHRLEGRDRPPELHAQASVFQSRFAQPFRASHHFAGEHRGDPGQGARKRLAGALQLAQQVGFRAREAVRRASFRVGSRVASDWIVRPGSPRRAW